MPVDLRVTCVSKSEGPDAHGRVLGIGGVDDFGTPWHLSTEQALAAIDAREFRFFLIVDGWRDKVIAAQGPEGRYLRCAADHEPNDLLRLPPCPRAAPEEPRDP